MQNCLKFPVALKAAMRVHISKISFCRYIYTDLIASKVVNIVKITVPRQ